MRKIISESLQGFKEGSDPIEDMDIGVPEPNEVAKRINAEIEKIWEIELQKILNDPKNYGIIYEKITLEGQFVYTEDGYEYTTDNIGWPEGFENFDYFKYDLDIDELDKTVDELMKNYQSQLIKVGKIRRRSKKDTWEIENARNFVIYLIWGNMLYEPKYNIEGKQRFINSVPFYNSVLENEPTKDEIISYREVVKEVLKNKW